MIRRGHRVVGGSVTKLSSARRMSVWDLIHNSDSQTARVLAQELPLQEQLAASVSRGDQQKKEPVMEPAPLAVIAAEYTALAPLAPVVPPDKMQILGDVIAPGLTPDQLEVFAIACNRTRLDPFAKQICAVVRYDSDLGRHKMTVQTTIDGFRVIASRTGKYDGRKPFEWCGPDGVWREVWLDAKAPAAARARILRKDFSEPLVAIARYKAYAAMKRDGSPTYMWVKMDAEQLAKCAEALALRTAFPQELSGLYTDDEMAQADARQADAQPAQAKPAQPKPQPSAAPAANGGKPAQASQPKAATPTTTTTTPADDGPRFADTFPIKAHAGKPMRTAPIEAIADYIAWLEGVLGDRSRQRLHARARGSKAIAEGIYRERAGAEMSALTTASSLPPLDEEKTAEIGVDAINASLEAEYERTHNTGVIDDDDIPY